MSPQAVQVAKLGGSLLVCDNLAPKLRKWLARQPRGHTVLVVGGGRMVDVVREADRQHGLGEEEAHWLAIDVMSISARLVASLLPEIDLTRDVSTLRGRFEQEGATIFDPALFLRDTEPEMPGTRLAHSWDVTSDSIAARLAIVLKARRLVLLKSGRPTAAGTLGDLAESGYVDRFLPRLERELAEVPSVDFENWGSD